ncbi:hypothetical protein ANK1_2801 [plant metagenome]|uniref:Phage tail assembly chaperone-like domain-containing protein n=1 Tax=plant metagenome TaxID=1297885 RepID=A0A484QPN5_9ZZZZ
MKKFAQIEDGRVHWVFAAAQCPEFHPDVVVIDITDVQPAPVEGMLYTGGDFQPPAQPLASPEEARARRDALLSASDWVTLRAIETGEVVPAPWLEYRSALRDLPEQSGFPVAIEWPTPPA